MNMVNRPYKKQAVDLRKAMQSAGFLITKGADRSLGLVLENLRNERVQAAVEAVAHDDYKTNDVLNPTKRIEYVHSSVFALTENYAIAAYRHSFLRGDYPDIFNIQLRSELTANLDPHSNSELYGRLCLLGGNKDYNHEGLKFAHKFTTAAYKNFWGQERFHNPGIIQLANYMRPVTPREVQRFISGRDGPPL
jgi:hypothetical protein